MADQLTSTKRKGSALWRGSKAVVVVAYLAVVAAVTGLAGWRGLDTALSDMAERGEATLALASDRLVSELQQYRELAVVLAGHPRAIEAVDGTGTARELFLAEADKTASREILVVDAGGRIVAAARDRAARVSETAHARATQGALGVSQSVGTDGYRVFSFAAPIFGTDGRPAGSVIVMAEPRLAEGYWLGDPEAVFFTDASGLVFVSNRSGLVMTGRGEGGSFPEYKVRRISGHELWKPEAAPYLPDEALHLTVPVPRIAMTGEILIDTAPAWTIARLQAGVAGALSLLVGALLFGAGERRRRLAVRLAVEEEANARLEERVESRTRDLRELNLQLTREVMERTEAEQRLRRTQEELVQAGKMSVLGQVSAGISHELNQPLMAIRSFAENAATFIERDRVEEASKNLVRIEGLVARMARIIQNLRSFARAETGPMGEVDLADVVQASLDLTEARIANLAVEVDWQPPAGAMVIGGVVRLQQVVTNLIANALDAMSGVERRVLRIAIRREEGRTVLSVADSGPGIAEPERVFEPFYTTKSGGESGGIGIGLSISAMLVERFGGRLTAHNAEGGGAVFEVELRTALAEAAE